MLLGEKQQCFHFTDLNIFFFNVSPTFSAQNRQKHVETNHYVVQSYQKKCKFVRTNLNEKKIHLYKEPTH